MLSGRSIGIIVWLLLGWMKPLSANTLVLSPAQGRYDLVPFVSAFEDKEGRFSVEDIRNIDQAGSFIPVSDLHKSSFGFTRSTIWFKVSIRNESERLQWILGSLRPDFYLFEVFIWQGDSQIAAKNIGTLHHPRDPYTRMPFGRFELPRDQDLTVYFRIRSDLQLAINFIVLDDQHHLDQATLENSIFYAYYGCLFALLVYNLCLFIFIRYKDYLMYVFFSSAMLLNAIVQGGYAEMWGFPWPLASTRDAHLVICLPAIAAMLYTRSFLNLARIAPKLDKLILSVVCLAVGLALLLMTPWGFSFSRYVSLFDLFSLFFVFLGAVTAIRHGDRTAVVFLIGWGSLASSVAVWVLGNVGVISKTTWVAVSPLMGNMLEMVLMSIALALRIKEIQQSRIEAEMKARERDNLQHLLRMVCHDISNPISIIKTVFFLASRRSQLKPDELKQWERVKRASDSIEGIINQVRRYEAFRSGKLAFELKPCSLRKVFEDIDFFFQTKAIEKGVKLSWRFIEESNDILVLADSTSLTHEIFNNLVSNAIKFTSEGGSVTLDAERIDNFAVITIRDTGIGMPRDILNLLFDPKANISRRGTNNESGTGFGMPLVKTFLEMFGGSIHIDSVEQQTGSVQHGTTIEIRLRIATSDVALPKT
ncbi:MAG TPA: sensor histidine kinase [Oligoflexus sp.]|uniref:sensor histidine kinase n=1 Tax=Oligoflexus sp. TaxID=1971216 RepID=UPI002D7E6169|nr:sensor histidine kinase [Oligoflexus sp.]HET9237164.1 sensor histidine kinase [Oligoflexus sp.]